jgi:hypothetical protein
MTVMPDALYLCDDLTLLIPDYLCMGIVLDSSRTRFHEYCCHFYLIWRFATDSQNLLYCLRYDLT